MRRTGPLYPALVALRILTRVPVLPGVVPSEEDRARSAPWFPVVGGLIGAVLAAVAALVLESDLVPAIVAALVLALSIFLTGAIHESGFGATADDLAGTEDEEESRRYRSFGGRVGFYGSLAVLAVVAVRGILLLGTEPTEWAGALIASQIGMRWTLLLLLKIGDRLEDHSHDERSLAVGPFTWASFGATSLFAIVAAMLFASGIALLSLVLSAIAAFFVGLYFQKRNGGLTSDSLGAASIVCELVVLVVFAAAFPAQSSPWTS